jgi:ParB family chromosome partitioning protein
VNPDYNDKLCEVDLDRIRFNPYQPRSFFSQDELRELAASIQSIGMVHPPTVRESNQGQYELISGERRIRAAKLAGLKKLQVLVRSSSYSHSAQAALIENIQRVDLNPIEIAKGLRQLMQEFKMSQEDVAQKIGKKRSTVANYLRLLSLPIDIQESVINEQITMGHAKAILSVNDSEMQSRLHKQVLKEGLTVREAEKAVLKHVSKSEKAMPEVKSNIYLEHIAEQLQQKLGTKVSIHGGNAKGYIQIDYYHLDDLDRLLDLFEISMEK